MSESLKRRVFAEKEHRGAFEVAGNSDWLEPGRTKQPQEGKRPEDKRPFGIPWIGISAIVLVVSFALFFFVVSFVPVDCGTINRDKYFRLEDCDGLEGCSPVQLGWQAYWTDPGYLCFEQAFMNCRRARASFISGARKINFLVEGLQDNQCLFSMELATGTGSTVSKCSYNFPLPFDEFRYVTLTDEMCSNPGIELP